MIMKKIYILLTLCCALIACKKNEVNFSYSPAEPRAGEKVQFTNLSSSGEEWEWTFGDVATSSLTSPSHIYKQPGKYTVRLKVDKKNAWTATKEVTVYDTIPTFTASDSVFYIYKDYTFTANVYNPYGSKVEYWWIGYDCEKSTLTTSFTEPGEATIALIVILDGDTTYIEKTFDILYRKTNSVLLRTFEEDYRQRIFGDRAAEPEIDMTATAKLNLEQDTMQVYNGYLFTLSELQMIFPEMEGFHIANRKIYFRANGLWIGNIDGANIVPIDTLPCYAMTLDVMDSRIYWANDEGVWYMPFVGSDNNKFVTVPERLNEMNDVIKIAADNELK